MFPSQPWPEELQTAEIVLLAGGCSLPSTKCFFRIFSMLPQIKTQMETLLVCPLANWASRKTCCLFMLIADSRSAWQLKFSHSRCLWILLGCHQCANHNSCSSPSGCETTPGFTASFSERSQKLHKRKVCLNSKPPMNSVSSGRQCTYGAWMHRLGDSAVG